MVGSFNGQDLASWPSLAALSGERVKKRGGERGKEEKIQGESKDDFQTRGRREQRTRRRKNRGDQHLKLDWFIFFHIRNNSHSYFGEEGPGKGLRASKDGRLA
jgi:hypothetical protein